MATETHRSKLRSWLADVVKVRTITEEATFELRYLDEVTAEEEIIAAWKDQIGQIHPSDLKTIRDVLEDTRTAVMPIPMKLAGRAEELGKLRSGWTVFRLLRKITPRRCYKCLEFGHVAKQCCSNSDWSKHCFKCGGQGHIAKTCGGDHHCLLCRGDLDADAKHITGGHKCAHYQAARQKLTYAGKWVLQLNLNHCEAELELLKQTVRGHKVYLTILSEHYSAPKNQRWIISKYNKASIWSCGKFPVGNVDDRWESFVKCTVNGTHFFSCYLPLACQ